MRAFIFLVVFGTAMWETTTSVPQIQMTKDMWAAEIKTQLDLYSKYFKARDFTKMSSLFTPDCTVMPPGAKTGIGRKAAIDIYATLPETGVDNVVFSSIEVNLYRNNIAANKGVATLRTDNGAILEVNKFVVIWKLVDGTPLFDTTIWNSETPTMLNAYAI